MPTKDESPRVPIRNPCNPNPARRIEEIVVLLSKEDTVIPKLLTSFPHKRASECWIMDFELLSDALSKYVLPVSSTSREFGCL